MIRLSITLLNARGLKNSLKQKAIFLFAIQYKTDFCFLQETHSIFEDVPFWKSQWGNTFFVLMLLNGLQVFVHLKTYLLSNFLIQTLMKIDILYLYIIFKFRTLISLL